MLDLSRRITSQECFSSHQCFSISDYQSPTSPSLNHFAGSPLTRSCFNVLVNG